MSKKQQISDADYQSLVARVAAMGYDTSKVLRVPQRP
jgi:apolipoprotein D and lipocalin family protein